MRWRRRAGIRQPDDWGWVGELDRRLLAETAKVSLELLLRGSEWVNRRVETIELVDEVTVRQSMSVDFRLPKELPGGFRIDGLDHYALPLIVLPRRSDLAYFDARDESGRTLPILTRAENARINGRMLTVVAEQAVAAARKPGPATEDSLKRPLRLILAGLPGLPRNMATAMVRVLVEEDATLFEGSDLTSLLADDTFRDLLGLFQWASPIHVPLQASPGERRVIKVSWEGRWGTWQPSERAQGLEASLRRGWNDVRGFAGWRPEIRVLDLPQLGGAQTHHVQISTPAGVELSEVSAPNGPPRVALPGGSGLPDPKTDPDQPRSQAVSRRVHLYLPAASEMRMGVLNVNLRTPRHGLLTGALLTGIFVTILLGVYAARAEEIIGQSDTGAAILLLVPALLAGFLVRPEEHAMARVLLRGPRLMTAALGALPLVAAGSLVASPDQQQQGGILGLFLHSSHPLPSWLPTLWWVLMGLAAALTAALGACLVGRGAISEDD